MLPPGTVNVEPLNLGNRQWPEGRERNSKMEPNYLQDINFFTTYRCNSRCRNCFIWQGQNQPPNKKELSIEQLTTLFADPLFLRCPSIGLAGGEPTISPFFWRLLDLLPDDKHVTITTNALSSKRLVDFLSRAEQGEKYLIQVSLDGIGETNDTIRGVKGAYRKTIALLEKLQELNVKGLVSFTINRLNFHQLVDCYDLADEYGAQFSTRMAHIGGAYLNKENRSFFEFDKNELEALDRALDMIISQELKKPSHFPARLVFIKKITDYYRGIQKNLPCMALKSGMVIDLYGDVFPNCPAMMKAIGNLHEESLSDIWWGKKAHEMRAKIDELKCGGCWNDCQVITNIEFDREFLDNEYSLLKIAHLEGGTIPDLIDFNQGDSSLLLSGWYDMEGDSDFKFRWTEQEFSILLPQGTTSLEIFAACPPDSNTNTPRTMEVITGRDKIDMILPANSGWEKYSIALARPTADLIPCTFRLNRYYCPKEEGKSTDGRKLGLAINKFFFMRS